MSLNRSRSNGAQVLLGATFAQLLASWICAGAHAQVPVSESLSLHLVADDVVGSDGSGVSGWLDSAGGGISADQATAARQPVVVDDVLNGHRAVRFDGVDDRLALSANLFASGAVPKTVFVALQSADAYGHVIGTGSASGGYLGSYGTALAIIHHKPYLKANSNSAGVELSSRDTLADGQPVILDAVLSETHSRLGSSCGYVDTDEAPSGYAYGVSTLGSTNGTGESLGGDLFEVLVYDRVLDSSEIQAVRSYLASRYALVLPAPEDEDGDAVYDACDEGTIYLNDERISVALRSPAALTGGTIANVIDASSASDSDVHTQQSHVWASADVELRFDLGANYDLHTIHFWNYFGEGYDVDSAAFTFLDADEAEVGDIEFEPLLGVSPIHAQDIPLEEVENVRYVRVLLTGTNMEVDFQNIGFSATPSPVVTPPDDADGGLADAGSDADDAEEGGVDAGTDAALDAAADGKGDAAVDAGTDAALDAAVDGGSEPTTDKADEGGVAEDNDSDGGEPDAKAEAGETKSSNGGGCSCSTQGQRPESLVGWLFLFGWLVARRRRSRA